MVYSLARWSGKVAVVTGASAGIGAAIAKKLVENGLEVVGIGRRKQLIEQHAQKLKDKKGKLHALKADISIEDEILNAFKWIKTNLSPIHILINNAGVMLETSILGDEGDSAKWRKTFDVNVLGLCVASREAVRNMKENNVDGHIVHMNSVTGHVVTGILPTTNVYAASKFAVRALNDSMRMELNHAKLRIKMSEISPGPVDTEIVSDLRSKHKHVDEIFKYAIKAEDVAEAVVFALSTPPNVQVQEIILKPVGLF